MKQQNILQALAKSHAIEILRSLNKEPKRFLDLRKSCRSNRTRSARLRELEEKGLVRVVPRMIGHRAYTFYEITTLGKEALKLGEKLLKLETKQKRHRNLTETEGIL